MITCTCTIYFTYIYIICILSIYIYCRFTGTYIFVYPSTWNILVLTVPLSEAPQTCQPVLLLFGPLTLLKSTFDSRASWLLNRPYYRRGKPNICWRNRGFPMFSTSLWDLRRRMMFPRLQDRWSNVWRAGCLLYKNGHLGKLKQTLCPAVTNFLLPKCT